MNLEGTEFVYYVGNFNQAINQKIETYPELCLWN